MRTRDEDDIDQSASQGLFCVVFTLTFSYFAAETELRSLMKLKVLIKKLDFEF